MVESNPLTNHIKIKRQPKKAIESLKYPNQVYFFTKKLGKGTQATVWKCTLNGQCFAGKVTANSWIYEDKAGDPEYWRKRMLSLCREFVFLQMVNHDNVIRLQEIIRTSNNYYCILEFANGGSLQDLLNMHQRFSETVAKEILKQIIAGCSALYEKRIMHRDLKLDNILIHFPDRSTDLTAQEIEEIDLETETFVVKIADLGYAREFKSDPEEDRAWSFRGSPLMMPAEQLSTFWMDEGTGYSHKIDVWAIGVILYQMLTGMFIFNIEAKSSYQVALSMLYKKIQKGDWAWPSNIEISLQCFDFLNDTMQNDPKLRPDWTQMQKHAFFTSQEKQLIPLNIIFNESPPEGIRFKDQKIYVNTKNPECYQKIHEAAITKYQQTNSEKIEKHLSQVLVENRDFDQLIPRMSRQLSDAESSQISLPELTKEEELELLMSTEDNDEAQRIVDEILAPAYANSAKSSSVIGARLKHENNTTFSKTVEYREAQNNISDPMAYLEGLEQTRDTIVPMKIEQELEKQKQVKRMQEVFNPNTSSETQTNEKLQKRRHGKDEKCSLF